VQWPIASRPLEMTGDSAASVWRPKPTHSLASERKASAPAALRSGSRSSRLEVSYSGGEPSPPQGFDVEARPSLQDRARSLTPRQQAPVWPVQHLKSGLGPRRSCGSAAPRQDARPSREGKGSKSSLLKERRLRSTSSRAMPSGIGDLSRMLTGGGRIVA